VILGKDYKRDSLKKENDKGISLHIIKELLNHSDLKTSQIYAHISTTKLVDTVNLIEINR